MIRAALRDIGQALRDVLWAAPVGGVRGWARFALAIGAGLALALLLWTWGWRA